MAILPFRKLFRWHVLAWAAYFAYVVVGEILFPGSVPSRLTLAQDIWLSASFQAARIATFYFCYLLVFPWALRVGRLPRLALGLVGAVLVFMAVRHGIEEGLYRYFLGFHNYSDGTAYWQMLFDGLYYTLPNMALAAALWAAETALRRERENQLLTTEKRAAEAAFLKTQINPHFLHNTLNMLFGLAYKVDKTLADSILKLSELMRYMLRDTPDGLVDLGQEIDYLENFLALYRLRYAGNFCAEFVVQGDPAGHRVAPLLLIPFVENACKHGLLDDPAAPLRLHLALAPGTVEFTVENRRHDYQTDATSGIGLANLGRRLALLYPGRYTLATGPVGPDFRARLVLYEGAVAASFVAAPPARVPQVQGELVA